MENFSTPRQTLVPRLTNFATVVAVAAATWWSGTQRQPEVSTEAALGTPAPAAIQQPDPNSPANLPSPSANQATWPATTKVLPLDSLQAVGFQSTRQR